MKMGKNIFSELDGYNWAKSASGNVTSQALSACLAESQFKECAAQQTLQFRSAAISSKATGSAAAKAATVLVEGRVGGIKTQQQHSSNQGDTKAVH
jgi:hypothetical protein